MADSSWLQCFGSKPSLACAVTPFPRRPYQLPISEKAAAQSGISGELWLCLPVYPYLPCPLTLAVTLGNPSVYQSDLAIPEPQHLLTFSSCESLLYLDSTNHPCSQVLLFHHAVLSTSIFFISRIFPGHIRISLQQPGPQGQPLSHPLLQCPLIASCAHPLTTPTPNRVSCPCRLKP